MDPSSVEEYDPSTQVVGDASPHWQFSRKEGYYTESKMLKMINELVGSGQDSLVVKYVLRISGFCHCAP